MEGEKVGSEKVYSIGWYNYYISINFMFTVQHIKNKKDIKESLLEIKYKKYGKQERE
mgnify:CR=1 FL=1